MTDFAGHLEAFQSNAWPAVLARLSNELGVSVASLQAFGVGLVPIVTFSNKKKGTEYTSYDGWWCNPERDIHGKVVGLSLRGLRDGKKIMYPGSKHGLIYELSPSFVVGAPVYQHGSENWTRTMDAGVDCPICGKPDGCLLSAENELDPKAVICIRVSDGCEKAMKQLGWLHIRKPEGRVNTRDPLGPSKHPVVCVEGMSDAAAARDMGLLPVGRPSASGGLTDLAELLRNRDVILIGENDQADQYGRKAGVAGLASAFEMLKPVCKSVVKVLPPEDVKDFRAWKLRYDLTLEQFLAYVAEAGSAESDPNLLASAAPLDVATRWLKDEHTLGDDLVLRHYKGQWFRYEEGRYNEIDERSAIRGQLYRFLQAKTYPSHSPNGEITILPFEPNRKNITDIVDALNMDCPLGDDPPCWLDGCDGPDPRGLICYRNGLLNVEAYLAGDSDYMIEATPRLFTLTAIPYDFDPAAECPLFHEWVQQTLGDDPAKIDLLQEWYGLVMTPDMSHEKLMLMQGLPGSGKGTSLDIQGALVGQNQICTTSFRSIASEYGRASLVGKLAAVMPDARLPRTADAMSALETLLAIVGRDAVNINRKYLPELPHHHLMTRFTIAVNELPELPDHSQALQRRLLMLHFSQSFVGREDVTMKQRLCAEAPGIAVWALEGLRRLKETGTFTLPESSKVLISEFKKVTSPIVEFVEEACEIDESRERECDKQELFDAWSKWCAERGFAPGYRSRFTQRLQSAFPLIGTDSSVTVGQRRSVYTGIGLQGWAQHTFLGRPE